MRAVFDTNIFVSALVVPGSRAEQAMLRVIDGDDALVISKPIIDELLGVLARKFSREREELARLAVFLDELAELIRPRVRVGVLEDDADNRILECAIAGRADIVVTGDRAILRLKSFQGVRILSLREYLAAR